MAICMSTSVAPGRTVFTIAMVACSMASAHRRNIASSSSLLTATSSLRSFSRFSKLQSGSSLTTWSQNGEVPHLRLIPSGPTAPLVGDMLPTITRPRSSPFSLSTATIVSPCALTRTSSIQGSSSFGVSGVHINTADSGAPRRVGSPFSGKTMVQPLAQPLK